MTTVDAGAARARVRALAAEAADLDAADPLAPAARRVHRRRDVAGLLRRQLARPPAAPQRRAARAIRARAVGRSPHPRVGRVLDGPAVRDRRRDRTRRDRRGARSDRDRRLDHRAALQAHPSRVRRAARARTPPASRSSSTPTTSPPTATSSRASPPSAAAGCAGSRSTAPSGVTADALREAVGAETAVVVLSQIAYRSGYLADARDAHAHRARRRRADPLGPLPLRRFGARSRPTRGASTSPSAARTSTSTAGRARPRSPTSPRATRRRSRSRSRAGWAAPTSSRWAPSTRPPPGMRRFLSGTPPIVGMLALQDTLALIEEVGIDAIRREVGRAHRVRDPAVRRAARPARRDRRLAARCGASAAGT